MSTLFLLDQLRSNRKRVATIMSGAGISSVVSTKYKATNNSKHDYPISDNILNRDFKTTRPNQKMIHTTV